MSFSGNLLKLNRVAYCHHNLINFYIVYQLQKRSCSTPDFTSGNSLFGNLEITKDVNTSHYKYSGFYFGDSLNAKNVIIFGCHMSFSSRKTNRENSIYVLGKDSVQGINGTTLYVEKIYKTDFTQQDRKFVLILHYNGDNSCLFANGVRTT